MTYLTNVLLWRIPMLLLVLVVYPTQVIHGQGQPDPEGHSAVAIDIRDYSSTVLGIDLSPQGAALSTGTEIKMTIAQDSTSPFVAARLEGERVWLVRSSASLDIECEGLNDEDRKLYDISVFVDSASGNLLKVVMRSKLYDPDQIRKPLASDADAQLDAANTCKGLPADAPTVSLTEALRQLPRCPFVATEIVAFYTLRTHLKFRDGKAHPAWDIFLYGSRWLGLRARGDEPIYMRNYIRYLVDATTGRTLMGTNKPTPERDSETE